MTLTPLGSEATALMAFSLTFVVAPLWVWMSDRTYSHNALTELLIRRMALAVFCLACVQATAIAAVLASASGLELTQMMWGMMDVFRIAFEIALIATAFLTIKDYLALYKLQGVRKAEGRHRETGQDLADTDDADQGGVTDGE
jgi:hypothetical protein